MHWSKELARLGACSEAILWARRYVSAARAWAACNRGDWMLWICARYSGPPDSISRKRLVRAALECAKLASPCQVAAKEQLRRGCLRTVEAYLRGKATLAQVCAAAHTTYIIDHTAPAASAAACAASYAAYAASYAADYAPYAAYAACAARAAYAGPNATLGHCAQIVRRYYPKPPRKEGRSNE